MISRILTQVRDNEYDLVLNADLGATRHHQWFYFHVSNTRSQVKYRFNILNFEKDRNQYLFGIIKLFMAMYCHIIIFNNKYNIFKENLSTLSVI